VTTPECDRSCNAGRLGNLLSGLEKPKAGIAVSKSGDSTLMADYAAVDIYQTLALMCGLTDDRDPVHWKKTTAVSAIT